MRNISRALSALSTLVFLSSVMAPAANAQGIKIGFVNDEQIKQDYKAWKVAQEEWELESRAWEDEAVTEQQELQELQEEYEKQKLILSEDKKREREAAINAKTEALDAYTRQIYGPGGTAERKQNQLIQPLLENITSAIEEVAIEGNYDIIFTLQSGLGYVKESYDVTEEVLKRLEDIE